MQLIKSEQKPLTMSCTSYISNSGGLKSLRGGKVMKVVFCDECGSLVVNEKCSNKKCNKLFPTANDFGLKIMDAIDMLYDFPDNFKSNYPFYPVEGFLPENSDEYDVMEMLRLNFIKNKEPMKIVFFKNVEEKNPFALMHVIGKPHYFEVQTVTAKMARGRINKVTPYIVRTKELGVPFSVYWGSYNLKKWDQITNSLEPLPKEVVDELSFKNYVLFSHYGWLLNLWRVILTDKKSGFSLLIPVDPKSLKDIFKLRDIPEGRERRVALKHWVSEHFKNAKGNLSSDEDLIYVHSYLRGQELFDWGTFTVEIKPSYQDVERYNELKTQAKVFHKAKNQL
jgi:hypothetical protein